MYTDDIILLSIVGNFVVLNFRYRALKAYFHGLIFVVCPEHVIKVACCLWLLFKCCGLNFHFGTLCNEKTKIIFPVYIATAYT